MPTERTKPTDTATERVKETDSSTERVITGGPSYDFSQEHIYWDREDIYFDDVGFHAIERTKETDTATERVKETDTATERTKET